MMAEELLTAKGAKDAEKTKKNNGKKSGDWRFSALAVQSFYLPIID
jgi:hypothetical protein